MALGGPLEEDCSARLLLAAGVVDMVLLMFLTQLLAPLVPWRQVDLLANIPPALTWLAVFAALTLSFWFIVEFLLGGQSIGRAALGLTIRRKDGNPLAKHHHLLRGMRKLMFLGGNGLNPNKAAAYDRAVGAKWHCDMAPHRDRPLKAWRLVAINGDNRGRSLTLGQSKGFAKNRAVRIGRDPNWADFILPHDSSVSGRHCVLMLRGRGMYLRDFGTNGKGSQNGTRLHGKTLPPCQWVALGRATHFHVANVQIKIER